MVYTSGLKELRDRFWYWHGASGKRYIHSIYPLDACPPLPGAVFTLVRRLAGGERLALEVGRFNENWDYIDALVADRNCGIQTADEIHVHLLADSPQTADNIVKDLQRAVPPAAPVSGFHEPSAFSPSIQMDNAA